MWKSLRSSARRRHARRHASILVRQQPNVVSELDDHLERVEAEVVVRRIDAHVAAADSFNETAGELSVKWEEDHGRLRLWRDGRCWELVTRDRKAADIAALAELEDTQIGINVLRDGRLELVAWSAGWTYSITAISLTEH